MELKEMKIQRQVEKLIKETFGKDGNYSQVLRVSHIDGTTMSGEAIDRQVEETGRACPKCCHCGVDTMYMGEYDCEKRPELSHVHYHDALRCEYYDPLSDEELEHRFDVEWPNDRGHFDLSFSSTGTGGINNAIRTLAGAIIERGYFTWQELSDVYFSLEPRDYDDWPRKIRAIAKLCEDIPADDLNRPTSEEDEEFRRGLFEALPPELQEEIEANQ